MQIKHQTAPQVVLIYIKTTTKIRQNKNQFLKTPKLFPSMILILPKNQPAFIHPNSNISLKFLSKLSLYFPPCASDDYPTLHPHHHLHTGDIKVRFLIPIFHLSCMCVRNWICFSSLDCLVKATTMKIEALSILKFEERRRIWVARVKWDFLLLNVKENCRKSWKFGWFFWD